jgi:hypothetical protein
MVLTLTVAANTMAASWGLHNDLLVTRIQLWYWGVAGSVGNYAGRYGGIKKFAPVG